jgi:WD40 repeat protein
MHEDGGARIWRVGSWKKQAFIRGYGSEAFASFSADDGRLVTGAFDGTVARIWDTDDGRLVAELRGHEQSVLGGLFSARFSPDGSRVVTAGADNTARVWDARSGQQRAILRGHRREVTDASYNPDGDRILTASEDGDARLFTADGAQLAVMRTTERASPGEEGLSDVSAVFSPDGKLAATVGGDGTARIWDGRNGRPLVRLRYAEEPQGKRLPTPRATLPVTGIDFNPRSDLVVTAGFDGAARIWDARSGQMIAVFREQHTPTTDATENVARFAPDGKRVLFSTDTGGTRLLVCQLCGALDELVEAGKARSRLIGP